MYVPTHEGKGAITATTLGGDYDPKQLTDIDYFQNKLYGSFRVPKQFFNLTDDGAGFNGGASLTIISSRYGKAIKSIQKAYCQVLTNLINILLWDKGLKSYINKFTIKMQTPITQEELDRRANMRDRMGVNQDVMGLVDPIIDDTIVKAKIVKSLLAQSLTNPEVIDLIQEHIATLEKQREEESTPSDEEPGGERETSRRPMPREEGPMAEFEREIGFGEGEPQEEPGEATTAPELNGETPEGQGDSYLPSPGELGIDMVANI